MRNRPCRTASFCLAVTLLGNSPAFAQEVVATPQEEERAREALRAGLDGAADWPGPFDPQSAKIWDMPPATDIAPGLYADLLKPSTEILSGTVDGEWLPGSSMPQQHRAATASAPAPEEAAPEEDAAPPPVTATPAAPEEPAKPPVTTATPAVRSEKSGKSRAAQKTHSTLRSGRASLVEKPSPEKKKPRKNIQRAAPKAPAVALPGELLP
jgi:hypothetical protein